MHNKQYFFNITTHSCQYDFANGHVDDMSELVATRFCPITFDVVFMGSSLRGCSALYADDSCDSSPGAQAIEDACNIPRVLLADVVLGENICKSMHLSIINTRKKLSVLMWLH